MGKLSDQRVGLYNSQEPAVLGLLGFIDAYAAERLSVDAERAEVLAAIDSRLQALNSQREALLPAIELQRPKVGRKPGHWFDSGRAYSVWLLAHSVWALRNGYDIIDFREPKKVSTRALVDLAIKENWDPVPVWRDGASLFQSNPNTLEQSVSRGRGELEIGSGWQSERCEAIFRKLFEFNANDKLS